MDRKKLSPPTRIEMEKSEREKTSLKEENHDLKKKLETLEEEKAALILVNEDLEKKDESHWDWMTQDRKAQRTQLKEHHEELI